MDILRVIVSFLTSREFAVNFLANLGGAMVGVLLAFWIERLRVRRDARMLYGRVLQTARSELAYLRPMCEHKRDRLKDGQSAGTGPTSFGVPAIRSLLVSPLVHEQSPYSLIMAVTILCGYLSAIENVFRDPRWIKNEGAVDREILNRLGNEMDKASVMISIALEQIDAQLKILGIEKTPDAMTQEVSRRLREVLQSSDSL